MPDMRHNLEMRSMIDRVCRQVAAGRLPWRHAAAVFERRRVPFEVTCRVLQPYASSTA